MTKLDLERFAEFNDSYEFVDDLYDEASTIPIRLTDKKYYGTILKYDTIKMEAIDEDDIATLKFNFNFLENPLDLEEDNKEFNNYLGDLLVNIIINTLNGDGVDNESGNYNLESLNLQ